jgi:hypothetical protein
MHEGLHEQISARKSFEDATGKRVYKKRTIGSVVELPTRRDADKAAVSFRISINSSVSAPQRMCDLIAYYWPARGFVLERLLV